MARAHSLCAAIDIGGTKVIIGLIDRNGHIVARDRFALHDRREPEQVTADAVARLRSLCTEADVKWDSLAGVGCCVACMLDLKREIVLRTPNVWRQLDVPLRSMLSRAAGLPVWLEMDANAAAVGEAWRGAGAGALNLVYVVLGTGIGSGILLDGHVYRGWGGTAGEVGHMILEPDGPTCGCGGHGCLEALASGSALARDGQRAASDNPATLIARLAGSGAVSAETVLQAARQGDATAQGIVERAAGYLGLGLVNLIHLLNPEVIVLGGGLILGGADLMLGRVRRVVAERCGSWVDQRGRRIELSALGDDAGILGVARQVWNAVDAQE